MEFFTDKIKFDSHPLIFLIDNHADNNESHTNSVVCVYRLEGSIKKVDKELVNAYLKLHYKDWIEIKQGVAEIKDFESFQNNFKITYRDEKKTAFSSSKTLSLTSISKLREEWEKRSSSSSKNSTSNSPNRSFLATPSSPSIPPQKSASFLKSKSLIDISSLHPIEAKNEIPPPDVQTKALKRSYTDLNLKLSFEVTRKDLPLGFDSLAMENRGVTLAHYGLNKTNEEKIQAYISHSILLGSQTCCVESMLKQIGLSRIRVALLNQLKNLFNEHISSFPLSCSENVKNKLTRYLKDAIVESMGDKGVNTKLTTYEEILLRKKQEQLASSEIDRYTQTIYNERAARVGYMLNRLNYFVSMSITEQNCTDDKDLQDILKQLKVFLEDRKNEIADILSAIKILLISLGYLENAYDTIQLNEQASTLDFNESIKRMNQIMNTHPLTNYTFKDLGSYKKLLQLDFKFEGSYHSLKNLICKKSEQMDARVCFKSEENYKNYINTTLDLTLKSLRENTHFETYNSSIHKQLKACALEPDIYFISSLFKKLETIPVPINQKNRLKEFQNKFPEQLLDSIEEWTKENSMLMKLN